MSYIIRLVDNPSFVLGESDHTITIDTHSSLNVLSYDTIELARKAIAIHLSNVPQYLFEIYQLPHYIITVFIGGNPYVLQCDESLVPASKSMNALRFTSSRSAKTHATHNLKGYMIDVSLIESEF
jgi:hypothetical protein